jgi:hypothetical protein
MRSFSPGILAATLATLALQPVAAAVHVRGHAVDVLDLPNSNAEANAYAIDLDGDGSPENQFASLLTVLASNLDTDLGAATQLEITAGRIVHLVELRSSDPAFANDAAAVATWYAGLPTPAPPLFDGSDTFRYDPAFDPARFVAPLVAGSFVSANPATTTAPVLLGVRIQIGAYITELPLQGARLKFTATATDLVQGQINGSISAEDIDSVFVPTLALAFDDAVQADPQSSRSMQLLQVFDTSPTDGRISVDEVRNQSVIQSLLVPDVDIRDAQGNYAPNPANTGPDSLSFGFGFTAVVSQTLLPQIFFDGFEP